MEPKVFVVDDDQAVRDSLGLLLRSMGQKARLFDSAQAFLDDYDPNMAGCIVLDIRMPGMSGMELQQKLKTMHCTVPIIFVTGHGDVPMAVEAMHHGAFDFIQKPFRDQELLDRINQALTWDQEHRSDEDYRRGVIERFQSLTPREREVMDCVVRGLANKVIAMDLSLSQRTVEIHRARVMEKMNARSLADLVRMSLLVSREP
ncbi:MAG: DNA-binding response regulator [Gammaproteobacteria bacterium]|nr:MAG: DNA-binding response regulator [Pseudomonadota bacterium]MBC6944940.1 DNA-binding response regulator [Gammaproteobacteria bacterium]MCE7897283.1 DNA-binding response regulator [Gammaproteobacteria bacterium PRO8]MDL1879626.1 response regulator transcription factor [Gammaproteobacteria bacterium PRO2]MCL4777270.1 response regulator transcription factor [Gammaproteobacteria bacterium]